MEIAGSIVAKIGEYLVAPIGQQFGYLIYHNNYIKNFRDQFQRLSVERAELQLLVDVAKRNGEVIAPRVEWWIQEVDKINERVERLLEENVEENRMVWNGRFPDLKSRYSLCRKAKKKTLAIAKLVRDGKFERVSYPAPPLEIGSSLLSIEAFKGFESRKKLKKKVLEALKDDEINMIAICGMGGIGKTTMVEEVKERVKADNLFDEVVMAMVSQNQDLRNIQARGLVQLQELDIRRCNHMEEILFKGGENEKAVDMIKFPKLRKIHLSDLPRLIGFCKPMDPVELVQPSNATNMQPFSNQEV
ncbi:disease resistance protein [Fagus crenata]